MSTENKVSAKIDYAAVRADLIARRDELNSMIAGVEKLLGSGISSATVKTGTPTEVADHPTDDSGVPSAFRADAFFGMTIVEAAKKYLRAMKKPQTTAQITSALQGGGYLFGSTNAVNTVGAVLHRANNKGDVLKVGKGSYGLPEWYPGRAKRGNDS
jgi:hypothetical protein